EPETYQGLHVGLETGQTLERDALIRSLVAIQYERNDVDFRRGTFRVRGDVVEIFPAAAEAEALRVELWGDSIEKLSTLDPRRGPGPLPGPALSPRQPLRHSRRPDGARHRGHPRRARRAAAVSQGPRQAPGGAAPRAAHVVRHGDAARDRLLPRHRELLAPPV